jgi:hypothetical protein
MTRVRPATAAGVAAAALLALPMGAFGRHHHRSHPTRSPGTQRIRSTDTSPPSLSALTAGTVTSFANNTLVVTLTDGQVLTGAITPATKMVCGTPPKQYPPPTKPPFGTTGPAGFQDGTSRHSASSRSFEPAPAPPRPEPPATSPGTSEPPSPPSGDRPPSSPPSPHPGDGSSVTPGPGTGSGDHPQPPAGPGSPGGQPGQPPAGYPGKGAGEPRIRPCGSDALTPGTAVHALGLSAEPKGVRFNWLALIKPAA